MLEESTGNFSASRNVYDWYQNETNVIVNVMIKNLKESAVKVRLIDEELDVACDMANGSVFKLHFNLLKSILVGESIWTVTPSKLEIKLRKTDKRRWQSLEMIPSRETVKRKEAPLANPAEQEAKRVLVSADEEAANVLVALEPIIEQADESLAVPAASSSPSPPKQKHDWYQSTTHVYVNVNILNLDPDKVQVSLDDSRLNVDCQEEDGTGYHLYLQLFDLIKPTECTYSLTMSKLEVKLAKERDIKWSELEAVEGEGEESVPLNNEQVDQPPPVQQPGEEQIQETVYEMSENGQEQQYNEHIYQTHAEVNEEETEVSQVVSLENVVITEERLLAHTDVQGVCSSEIPLEPRPVEGLNNAPDEKVTMEVGQVDELLKEIFEKGGSEVRKAMSNNSLLDATIIVTNS